MSWSRKLSCRVDEVREGVRVAREHRRYHQEDEQCLKAEYRAAQRAGEVHTHAGLGSGFGLLPWLLLGMGAFSNLFQGETSDPWIGGLGLLTFNSLYIYVAFRAFRKETREALSTRVALVLLGLVTCGLALGYGGNWLLFFPLFGLATGAVVRLPHLRWVGAVVTVVAGAAAVFRDGWGGLDTAYATWISIMVTAAIMSLSEAVRQLREAREELARRAVEEERLRFSRDLHDLLGHTLSVIVVKSEAARRLAPRDLDAALLQVGDIESVGRQALTEIREAVTGYREGSLGTDLDGAVSALRAAGIEPAVHRSGPPLTARTEALLGWVVREAVTNVVRHSGARNCEISVRGSGERVRLRVRDDGRGTLPGAPLPLADGTEPPATPHTPRLGDTEPTPAPHPPRLGGTGLIGLTERLAAAGGSLEAGPGTGGGFVVRAELPTESGELVRVDGPTRTADGPRTGGTDR
ncbi:two-component system sensor histidine kinase DesK [Streptomyces sp. SAI-208]|uniref:sensor histidine kinase n=1 Tax=Streptomyces sp. SAI-208 TaxID=2940550 RepID=UPI002474D19E|nr:sensor histidine kinase [Streptomyces sp. SAI-208]MDH6610419.1 two-component system sensor histidine kinase DesK [Streptomyces sp. SAI-208]